MQFQQWLSTNHPDQYDEGFWKNLAAAGLIAGSLAAPGCSNKAECPHQSVQQKQRPSFRERMYGKQAEHDWQDLHKKAEILRQHGLKKGTFIQGQLQNPNEIKNQSTTSDDAADYL
jgi:hypothetical protein